MLITRKPEGGFESNNKNQGADLKKEYSGSTNNANNLYSTSKQQKHQKMTTDSKARDLKTVAMNISYINSGSPHQNGNISNSTQKEKNSQSNLQECNK